MKNLFLYADKDAGLEARLQAAFDVSRAFEGHLTCLQLTPFDTYVMPDALDGGYALQALLEDLRAAQEANRPILEERLRREGMSWDWLRVDGPPASVLARRSWLADLIVLSLPEPAYDGPRSLVGEVAVHAGAPVLAMPLAARSFECTAPAVVAWNGAREAAHALRAALPMLRQASDVHIVTVTEDDTAGFPATEVSEYLALHGIGSELHIRAGEGSVAKALQDAARTLGAGYVVMGAYGHSRAREMVLGGVTRDMLFQGVLPLLLAH